MPGIDNMPDTPRVPPVVKQNVRQRLAADPRAWNECQEGSLDPIQEIKLTLLGLTEVIGLEYADLVEEIARDARRAAQHAQQALDATAIEMVDPNTTPERYKYLLQSADEEREQRDYFRRQTRLLLECGEALRRTAKVEQ